MTPPYLRVPVEQLTRAQTDFVWAIERQHRETLRARIPAELRRRPRWVAHRPIEDKKPPVGDDGRPLVGWNKKLLTFEDACTRADRFLDGGLGFAPGDGISAFDLDHCRNPITGDLHNEASTLIEGNYAEVSPSGDGVHVFGLSALPPAELRFAPDDLMPRKTESPLPYLTVTGRRVAGDGNLADITHALDLWNSIGQGKASGGGQRKNAGLPDTIPDGERNDVLTREAGRLRRRGMSEAEILATLGALNEGRCRPPLPDRDVERIARSVSRYEPAAQDGTLDPKDPMSSARLFLGNDHVRHQAGVFYRWSEDQNAWPRTEDAVIRAEVWRFLEQAKRPTREGPAPFMPTPRTVSDVLDAARGLTNLPASVAAPLWLDGSDEDPRGLIAFSNGLLRTRDRLLLPPDPSFYNHVALPFAFDPEARVAQEWGAFLQSVWPEDEESVSTLQEVFGYLVSGETRFQKIFAIVGPKRSGKGTTGRVLREILGPTNVCGPTLASLADQFGREALIHKTAAIVSDARITGRTDTALVAENLLRTSGEDAQDVARKFLPAWTGQLRVRFLLLTNELPRIEDASGALASRFVILRMTRSFLGHEDLGLFERLVPELPAILNWSLDGWDRLRQRGHFVVPGSARDLVSEFEDLGSPIGSFLRDCCELGDGHREAQHDVFEAWRQWCARSGRQHVGTAQTFAKELRAAVPGLEVRKVGGRGGQVRHWEGLRLRGEGQVDIDHGL